MRCAPFHHIAKVTARRVRRRSQGGESCGSRSRARVFKKLRLYSNARAHWLQLSCVDHPDPTNRAAMLMLVIIENTSTSSTVQEMIVPPRRSRAYAKIDDVAARPGRHCRSNTKGRAMAARSFKSNVVALKRSRLVPRERSHGKTDFLRNSETISGAERWAFTAPDQP